MEPKIVSLAPPEERLHRLDAKFGNLISMLHDRLETLFASEPFTYSTRPKRLPTQVVYLFSEANRPLYVGRSNHFGQRLGSHCHESSRANQSPFAFKLAREAAGIAEASYMGPNTRSGLMTDPAFMEGFARAKARLNRMNIRFVEEPDQVQQALLEIYCAVALQTPYNEFGTH